MLIPKAGKPYRSTKWIKQVKQIGSCQLCGSSYNLQSAHRNRGKAFGLKVDDCLSACLCVNCHVNIDNGAQLSKDERRYELDKAIVLTLHQMSMSNLITVSSDIYIHESIDDIGDIDEVDQYFSNICEWVKNKDIKLINA